MEIQKERIKRTKMFKLEALKSLNEFDRKATKAEKTDHFMRNECDSNEIGGRCEKKG